MLKYLVATESDLSHHPFIQGHTTTSSGHLEPQVCREQIISKHSSPLCGSGCFLSCQSILVLFGRQNLYFSQSLSGPVTSKVDSKLSWLGTAAYYAAELRTAARSALHATKNTQVKMSHVLQLRQLQWDETAWLMYKALQQSLIQDDIWGGWSSWQTQATETVDLRTPQDPWSRADEKHSGR